MRRVNKYAISLGSNRGDRYDHLVKAVAAIGAQVDHYRVSSLYETEPVGGPDQDPFLNAVMVVETSLDPQELLDRLQAIENDHGRERTVRWGPRTLDLDIVASDTPAQTDERLTIPHPRASERAFVLVPLAELWPHARVDSDMTAAQALPSAEADGVDRLIRNWPTTRSRFYAWALVGAQFALFIAAALGMAVDGNLPDGQITIPEVIGALLAMSGLILGLLASLLLGPSFSPSPLPTERARMVMRGPYRYVRHPIYGGVVLFVLGAALFSSSLLGAVAAVTILVFFWAKTLYEERHLRIRFPGYRRYRNVVRWRLIPFVI